jgi:hypothetical protein
MPDRETPPFDQAPEGLIAHAVRSYAEGGVRPIDPAEIAVASMARPTAWPVAWLTRLRNPAPGCWR